MGRSRTHRFGLAALVVAGLALAACGGDDDSDAGDATETAAAVETTDNDTADAGTAAPAATEDDEADEQGEPDTAEAPDQSSEASATADDDGDDDGEKIVVDDIGDIPQECRDQIGEYLRQLEPIVSDIDWDSATMADFEAISERLDEEMSSIDDEAEAACGDFDFSDDEDSMRFALEIAEDEAPGTVAWLEWISEFSRSFTSDAPEGGPADCESAITYVEGLIAEGKTMSSVQISELTQISSAITVISEDCSADRSGEFFTRQDVTAFLK